MKTLAAIFVLVGALLSQGCTYVPGVKPTDMSAIREQTATRTEIEHILGEPSVSWETNDGSIDVYVYDRGAEGGVEGINPGSGCGSDPVGCLVVVLLLQPFVWASTPFLYSNKVDEQEGYLTITYDQDGHILAYTTLSYAEGIDPEVAYKRHVAATSHTFGEGAQKAEISDDLIAYNGTWVASDGAWTAQLSVIDGRFRMRAECGHYIRSEATGQMDDEGRMSAILAPGRWYKTVVVGTIERLHFVSHNSDCRKATLTFQRIG